MADLVSSIRRGEIVSHINSKATSIELMVYHLLFILYKCTELFDEWNYRNEKCIFDTW